MILVIFQILVNKSCWPTQKVSLLIATSGAEAYLNYYRYKIIYIFIL